MASIRGVERHGQHTVHVRGRLTAADLRRLERACSTALEAEVLPLEIRLDTPVTDLSARAYLTRLVLRGAVIRTPDVPATQPAVTSDAGQKNV